jgi:peptide/nickel transport system permease protein
MTQYALNRIILTIPTLIAVTMIVFAAVRFLPGDVVDHIVGEDYGAASPEFRAKILEYYSLDDSMPQQYVRWMWDMAQGDLGSSILTGRSVESEMRYRFATSAFLGTMAATIALVVAIPVGAFAALKQDTIIDYLARTFAIVLLAMPNFWLALLVILYGFIWFGWTPPLSYQPFWEDPFAALQTLWVPAIILSGGLMAIVMRLLRSAMLETLRQDYVRTARAKGLRGRTVVTRHVLRNAMIPVVTVIGLAIPNLIGGTVIMETVFSVPGLGKYLYDSIQTRDYPVVQAVVLLGAFFTVMSNLAVDLSYSIIDPRIRREGR